MYARDNVFDPVEYITVPPSPLPSPDRAVHAVRFASTSNVYKTAVSVDRWRSGICERGKVTGKKSVLCERRSGQGETERQERGRYTSES